MKTLSRAKWVGVSNSQSVTQFKSSGIRVVLLTSEEFVSGLGLGRQIFDGFYFGFFRSTLGSRYKSTKRRKKGRRRREP